ncbi:cupin domain-containing protein [Gorillibacterium sp. CAU 1737]|uniref:cupin domain-containing protein n=1 Tax=Gorillibacterium sp. CAU 1737 TaxID=3140362 RepID=UPI003261119C
MNETLLFDAGEPNPFTQYFIGQSYLNMLTPGPNAIGNVTFEPGCRNHWHAHAGGQLLLVTAGEGYYQAEGKLAQRLKAGDVVVIPAGVKHWHGAAEDSWFVHLAAVGDPSKPETEWYEPVNDDQYAEVNKIK